jgi:chemotaxis protein MotB
MKNPSVIIIRKPRKGGHAGHHGGAWKVAYADFVTAMMAFFLVMWLVAQSQGVREAVAGYFKDPGIFDHQKSNGPIAGGNFQLDPNPPPRLRETQPAPAVMVKDQETLEKTAGRLRDLLSQLPEFKRLGKQIEIQLTPEGLRIELLETNDSTFFDSGSATLKLETVHILSVIARELAKLQNDLILEGHTDSRGYANVEGYSNWELSADRANAARRVMERAEDLRQRVKGVRGYADTRLRFAEQPLDPRNRRVSIIVQNLQTSLTAKDLLSRIETRGTDAGPTSAEIAAR